MRIRDQHLPAALDELVVHKLGPFIDSTTARTGSSYTRSGASAPFITFASVHLAVLERDASSHEAGGDSRGKYFCSEWCGAKSCSGASAAGRETKQK